MLVPEASRVWLVPRSGLTSNGAMQRADDLRHLFVETATVRCSRMMGEERRIERTEWYSTRRGTSD